MNKELIIKKCLKCGAMVRVVKDCNCPDCGMICCNEPMKTLKENSDDTASIEKHVPTYEINEKKILVKVNHVMEDDHFIEWIALVNDKKEETVKLYPGNNAECDFNYEPNSKLYAYCNKHGLWSVEIK